ncbi:MAG: response regulator transcription factor [Candidatus Melainabacteria bacterium]|nr:response regulator transcription factor [Candidatus Melainabacteria bacterium]
MPIEVQNKIHHSPIEVLLVEDSDGDAKFIHEILSGTSSPKFDVIRQERLSGAMKTIGNGDIDIILLDLSLPDSHGLETFVTLNSKAKNIPIIVLTGLNDEEIAIKAVQEGAQDYIVKGQLEKSALIRSIRYAIGRSKKEEIQLAKKEESTNQKLSDLHITKKEREILSLVAAGKTNEEIAKELDLSISTIRNHLARIFAKLRITNRAQATAFAIEAGLFRVTIT